MNISIVIPSYKRSQMLAGTLLNLTNQKILQKGSSEILISIDESDPEFNLYEIYLKQIQSIYSDCGLNVKIKLLVNNSTGLVKAKNNAVEKSKSETVMMMDDDLFAESNYIYEVAKDLSKDDRIAATSGYIVTYLPAISHTQPSDKIKKIPIDNKIQKLEIVKDKSGGWRSLFGQKEQVMDWSYINSKIHDEKRFEMDYFVNSYIFKKKSFENIGGYNESLNSKTSAHEEVDFTYRLMKSGYINVFNPFVRMWHLTVRKGGIYKGIDLKESKKILEKEYNESIGKFYKSIC